MNHYKKWLHSSTNTYSHVSRKEVLEDMFSIIMKWFLKYPELEFMKKLAFKEVRILRADFFNENDEKAKKHVRHWF